MDKYGIWSIVEAKPGKEAEVEAFLRECQTMIEAETSTTCFYALKVGPSTYATFDTMVDDAALDAHVGGQVADNVRARAPDLFKGAPEIVKGTILAAKTAR